MSSSLATDILSLLEKLSGGPHAGFRPVHAKGQIFSGTFTPSPEAARLTRAPHASRSSTPVTVRFSVSAGDPKAADNAPMGSSPQGMAVRFHLADHVHTDIVAHSHNGFPARNGEEFLAFLQAAAASGPGSGDPPPIVKFLMSHPAAKAFVEAPKPIPASYARQAYFAITAFKFTNAAGESRLGRFQFRPEAGMELLTPEQAAAKKPDFLAADMADRLSRGPVRFRVLVQLAEPGDDVTNPTVVWPDSRTTLEFGSVTITERVDELAPDFRKIIFDPVPRADGIDSAGDPLTELRSEVYLMSGRRRRASAR